MGDGSPETTRDAFFGGRLILEQPVHGHRSGTDAVLLAAAVPPDLAGQVVDVGAGVGAVGLGIARGAPGARVTLVENDAAALSLAARNVAANRLADRVDIVDCDILAPGGLRGRLTAAADFVVTNPPFHRPGRGRSSPVESRRAAHVLASDAGLAAWFAACLAVLAPKGQFAAILPASELPEALTLLARRLGDLTVLPVHPRAGEAATRILLRGRAGSRAPFRIAAPLILHDADGFSADAARLASGDDRLNW